MVHPVCAQHSQGLQFTCLPPPHCRSHLLPPSPLLQTWKQNFLAAACSSQGPSFSSPPASSPKDSSSRKGKERKRCNDKPKPFHLSSPQIYQPAQFSASLPLSLAHNQMITPQGFAQKRHEASPLPIWEGASHYTQKEMHLFPEAAWGRKSS